MVQGIIVSALVAEVRRAVDIAETEDKQRAIGGWLQAFDVLSFGCTMRLNGEGLIRGMPHNRSETRSPGIEVQPVNEMLTTRAAARKPRGRKS